MKSNFDLAAQAGKADSPAPVQNAALREIAGRISKLPYRDLLMLAAAVAELAPSVTGDRRRDSHAFADTILAVADDLKDA